ncbi:hypothetical protein GQ600_11215 [Phytophthora cactorum]|nr:hypothetical protein GQ600_11215 [Phytophthora cactorum]
MIAYFLLLFLGTLLGTLLGTIDKMGGANSTSKQFIHETVLQDVTTVVNNNTKRYSNTIRNTQKLIVSCTPEQMDIAVKLRAEEVRNNSAMWTAYYSNGGKGTPPPSLGLPTLCSANDVTFDNVSVLQLNSEQQTEMINSIKHDLLNKAASVNEQTIAGGIYTKAEIDEINKVKTRVENHTYNNSLTEVVNAVASSQEMVVSGGSMNGVTMKMSNKMMVQAIVNDLLQTDTTVTAKNVDESKSTLTTKNMLDSIRDMFSGLFSGMMTLECLYLFVLFVDYIAKWFILLLAGTRRADTGIKRQTGQGQLNTDDNTGKSNVTITTGAKTGLAIDDNQNIVMEKATLVVDQQGALQVRPSGSALRLDATSVYMIAGALRINNSPVLASADQLNYTIISPGTASRNKALVVDDNRDMTNINTIIAQTLQGLIQTPDQPGIRSLTDVDVTGCFSLRNKKLLASAGELNRLYRATPGIALPTRAVILDDNKSLFGVNALEAETIRGSLTTGTQPAICSVASDHICRRDGKLNVAGDLNIGQAGLLSTVGARLVLSEPDGKLLCLMRTESARCDIFLSSAGDLELNPTKNVFLRDKTGIVINGGSVTGVAALEAQTITGTIATSDQTWEVVAATMRADSLDGQLLISSQPNITEVGQLSHLEVQNGITAAFVTATTLSGVLTSPEQVAVTKVGRLSSLDVQNSIVAASVTAFTLSGTLTSPEQVAVTKVGRLVYLNVENSIVATSVTADTLSGTLTSPEQVAVTKIGTLSRLNTIAPIGIGVAAPTCAIDINTSSLTTPAKPSIRLDNDNVNASIGLVPDGLIIQTSGKTVSLGVGVGLKFDGGSLTGLNAMSVSSIQGTMLTAAQPFITSIGSLSGLTTDFIGVGLPCTASPPYRLDVLSAPTGGLARLSNGVDTLTLRVVDHDFTINVTNSRLALGTGVDLVMNGGAILGLNKLEAASISTPSLTISGIPVTHDVLSSLANATAGAVNAGSFISVDANRDVAGIRDITCSALSGTLLTGIQKTLSKLGF